jgi:hypothetical protein
MFMYAPNLWLVLAAAVLSLIVGWLWYSPAVLGRTWATLTGREMAWRRNLLLIAVATLVEAYVTAHLVYYVGAYGWWEGAKAGLWLWFGYLATTLAVSTATAGQRPKVWLIDAGFQLASLLIMGAIFATW